MMRYGNVPGIEKPISRLVQGSIMMSTQNFEAGAALFSRIVELGCTCFDTAHDYGNGDVERAFGRWLNQSGLRDKIVILGKGAHHSQDRKRVTPFDISADIHDSLARMQVSYIDLYVLHRDNPELPVGPIVEVLNEHKAAGRIHAFGGSNWAYERVQEANAYAQAFVQIGQKLSGVSADLANYRSELQIAADDLGRTEEALADVLFAEDFGEVKQQRARAASRGQSRPPACH